jgi:probable FeS assembly SUF system protein SufT
MLHTEKQLTRDVEAIQIPSGFTTTLHTGMSVTITQALGTNYTVVCERGLFRIDGKDADALGIEPGSAPQPDAQALNEPIDGKASDKEVWAQLRTCYDPEIPVNIVDLGLVYDCVLEDHAEGGSKVTVKMTLTAPGCGMGPVICSEAQQKISCLPGVREADVQLVWDPPWNQGMISEVGRMKLGLV